MEILNYSLLRVATKYLLVSWDERNKMENFFALFLITLEKKEKKKPQKMNEKRK